jgi:hypothetical protein
MKSQIYWLRTALEGIREFFWPLLERSSNHDGGEDTSSFELKVPEERLEETVELTTKILESEEERRKGIETKAALFIGTISFASSIVIAANILVGAKEGFGLAIKISVIVSFILSLYAARTILFSIKALERRTYGVISLSDINVPGDQQQFQKHLIKLTAEIIQQNESTINTKVDHLTLAQEYFKRAVITIVVYAFMILLFGVGLLEKEPRPVDQVKVNSNLPKTARVLTKDSLIQVQSVRLLTRDTVSPMKSPSATKPHLKKK